MRLIDGPNRNLLRKTDDALRPGARPAIASKPAQVESSGAKKPASAADGFGAAPLSRGRVQGDSALEIATGRAQAPARPEGLDAAALAGRVKDGKVSVTLPMEGTFGPNPEEIPDWVERLLPMDLGFKFAKGSQLKLDLEVKDGKVVPGKTQVTLEPPPDGPLRISVDRVYLDENNSLKVELHPDIPFGDRMKFSVGVPGMKELPRDIDALVSRFTPPAQGEAEKPGFIGRKVAEVKSNVADYAKNEFLEVAKLDQVQFDVKGTLKAGPLELPGGSVTLGAKNQVTVKGGLHGATLDGTVDLKAMDVALDGVALKTGAGKAKLHVDYKHDGDTATVNTRISNLSVDSQYVVQKRQNGDYISLAEGTLKNASLDLSATLPFDGKSAPGKPTFTETKLDVPEFRGTVAGARVTVPDADGTATIEVGRSTLTGAVNVSPERVRVDGKFGELDVSVKDFAHASDKGAVKVDDARLRGRDGTVSFDSRGDFDIEAQVDAVEARVSDAKVKAGGVSVDMGESGLSGSGKVRLSSNAGHGLQGDWNLWGAVDGAKLENHAQVDASLQQGAHVNLKLTEAAVGTQGEFAARGSAAVVNARADVSSKTLDAAGTVDLNGAVDFEVGRDAQGNVGGNLFSPGLDVGVRGDVKLGGVGLQNVGAELGVKDTHLSFQKPVDGGLAYATQGEVVHSRVGLDSVSWDVLGDGKLPLGNFSPLAEGTRFNASSGGGINLQTPTQSAALEPGVELEAQRAAEAQAKAAQDAKAREAKEAADRAEQARALPVLRRGAKREEVRELQKRLAAAGFDSGPLDGSFGPITQAAVRAYQTARGLTVDGIVGPQTWGSLLGE